jgi:hypothetical protein
MAAKRLSPALAKEALAALKEYGSECKAARGLGISRNTLQSRLLIARAGLTAAPPDLLTELKKGPRDLESLAERCETTPGKALDALLALQKSGTNLHQAGSLWSVQRHPEAGAVACKPYKTHPDGTFIFGAMGDTHLCSKYARLDVLTDLYRRFSDAGVDRVFHTGNWIDGESHAKNLHDIDVHGMDRQIHYMADVYPKVEGITTYAVAGNDHEGWYGQREGIDIGRHAEMLMHKAGRTDWIHLGFMEAFIPIVHPVSKSQSMLLVMHPGGGSSYAVSYTSQKIAESFEGGEKPAMTLLGHYHKMEYLRTRNVRMVQTGCTQDPTPWSRAKRLRYELGGWIVRGRLDKDTGAIMSCSMEDFGYFDKGYHTQHRWSHGGAVNQVTRV